MAEVSQDRRVAAPPHRWAREERGRPAAEREAHLAGGADPRIATLVERGAGVTLLAQRRSPNGVDVGHLTVGPGGVTVIALHELPGDVAIRRRGGRLRRRIEHLMIGGRDRCALLDDVARQLGAVHLALGHVPDVDVRAALCLPRATGLAVPGRLTVRGVLVDGPRGAARLAERGGPLTADAIDAIAVLVAARLPRG
jgi:hypothetical protein